MTYKTLKKYFNEQSILNDISGILSWDMSTYMPENSRVQRAKQFKILSDYRKRIFDLIKKEELFKKVSIKKLNLDDRKNFILMKSKFDYYNSLPDKLLEKKTLLSIECEGLWRKARIKNNFNIVKKKLVQLMQVVREESEILSQKKQLGKYDCLLEKYDRSLDTKMLNTIFKDVEIFLKSNLRKIENVQKKRNLNIRSEYLDECEQIKLSKIFMSKLGFNFSKGRIDKSLHPFCGGSTDDVRITTRFNKKNIFSCFDALMHETGHGLYEQGLPIKWKHQPLGTSAGMSVHESQSLFLEMQLIKSKPASKFIEKIIRKNLKKKSPYWENENIYFVRNKIQKGYIRVDSDEVHYPLHIILRYKIEKEIVNNGRVVESLPDLWNSEFEKLFGLEVKDDNNGCLQDIHWFGGDIGYFPTYSIGAFIASQIRYSMKKDISDMNKLIEKGQFKKIISWLRKRVHQKGNFYKINELLLESTKSELDVSFYKKHITEKYMS